LPGVGPVLALTILAETGDIRRFGHVRQFLKYAGLDLATAQSGLSRGMPRLSKRGNARLCLASIRFAARRSLFLPVLDEGDRLIMWVNAGGSRAWVLALT
jgi:transposase